jgi:hypothetical protein
LRFQVRLVIPGPIRKLLEQRNDIHVESLLEPRDEFHTNLVAAKSRVEVCGINAKRQVAFLEFRFNLGARQAEKRPNDLALEYRIDPSQAAGAGPAQQAQENCFRLVVRSVRRRDLVQPAAVNQGDEKPVANFPRGGLQVSALLPRQAADLGASADELEGQAGGLIAHEALVFVGSPASAPAESAAVVAVGVGAGCRTAAGPRTPRWRSS